MKTFRFSLISVLFILFALNASAQTVGMERDSLALVALYDSTNGADWTNKWDLNTPVSEWYGITVTNGRVTKISVFNNNLDGVLPEAIGNLDSLNYFRLGYDNIGGVLPDTIWGLSKLTYLYLSNTQLEGQIPAEIGNLKELETINIGSSQLSGTIPPEIGQCTKLNSIRLGNQNLSGALPDEMANLTELTDLWISSNHFSGPFPAMLLNLTKLECLNLGGNNFSGPIPPEIGTLTNLIWVYLSNNNFSGEIPKELGSLKNATFLQLYSNDLSGFVPEEIGQMESLQYLRLYHNNLSGPLPDSIANLTNLKEISISYNSIDYLPDFSSLPNLEKLKVDNNKLKFSDLESQTFSNTLTTYQYNPQDSIGTGGTTQVNSGDSLQLSVNAGGTVTHYQWQKNGSDIPAATDSNLVLLSVQAGDAGKYICVMTNDSLPGLTLISHAIHLTVKEGDWILREDTEWSGVVQINSNVMVPDSVTLSILPGSEIQFIGHYKIDVKGRLLALGTQADSIYFYALEPNTAWAGIRFDSLSLSVDSSIFDYCILEDGNLEQRIETLEGGAISIRNTDQIRISRSQFSNNYATHGGALFVEDSNPVIAGNTFCNNEATYGGALFLRNSSLQLEQNLFEGNNAQNDGGAVYLTQCSHPVIAGNRMIENTAGTQGSAVSCFLSDPSFYNNLVQGNSGSTYGGGIFFYQSQPLLEGNHFEDNTAAYGGAIFAKENSQIRFVSGKAERNTATKNGGAFYLSQSGLVILNSLLAENEANYGGALSYTYGQINSVNNTFADNHAGIFGGAVYNIYTEKAKFVNSIFWGNDADSLGSQFYFTASDSAEFRYCNIEGDSAAFSGDKPLLTYIHNLNSNPDFSGNEGSFYRLAIGSPCLDAGTPDTSGLGLPAFDLAGNARVQDGRIDMGALEGGVVVIKIDEPEPQLPLETALQQNYPNPFNPQTIIRYQLSVSCDVKLTVYNSLGQNIQTLVHKRQEPGRYSVRFEATNLASGIYYYKIQSGSYIKIRKMILLH